MKKPFPPMLPAVIIDFSRAVARRNGRQTVSRRQTPLLVGFFLAGLVIHGGLQGWWIAPVNGSLSEAPLFLGSTLLTVR